jgi:hypothetical protein
MKISNTEIQDIIKSSKGRIFTATFLKKDNSLRKMTCRLGVKKNLSGGANNTAHISKYITVYDMLSRGYRNINIETVPELQVDGSHYEVV